MADDRPGPTRITKILLALTGVPALMCLSLIPLRLLALEPYHIASAGMVPTLPIGEHVLVQKLAVEPELGDVLVFRYPRDRSIVYLKRIVGMPGDTVQVRGSRVVRNGQPVPLQAPTPSTWRNDRCEAVTATHYDETLGAHVHGIYIDPRGNFLANVPEVTVPKGHYYVMGDNRDHSEDSRRWGFVPADDVVGIARWTWMSRDHCEGGIRGHRLLRPVD